MFILWHVGTAAFFYSKKGKNVVTSSCVCLVFFLNALIRVTISSEVEPTLHLCIYIGDAEALIIKNPNIGFSELKSKEHFSQSLPHSTLPPLPISLLPI